MRSRLAIGMLLTLGCAAAALAGLRGAPADTPSKEGLEFYEQKVRPILVEHCFRCHSHAASKARGGLVVDSRGGLLKGGDTGPAVVPGDAEKSLLIRAVRHAGEDLQMPPGGKKLADEQIDLLVKWVDMGAPAPDTGKVVKVRGKITDEDRAWWAFQPLQEPPVPSRANDAWSRNEMDRFILQRLGAEGLQPSPEADRRSLIRRVYFDLIGLPPAPKEVDDFLADTSANAYEKLIDRLLDSPHYGERWARHWLDLVRYAESDGFRIDEYRPHAWRYRDYVIKSFNDDKPYDRFVLEQLAGDEVDPDNPEARIATGFLRHTIYEYNQRDVRTQWSDMLNDVTDVTGDVFLGLGMGCARCHDHKFDPILQKDYYRLQAFFTPFLPREDIPLATAKEQAEYQAKMKKWEELTADIHRQIEAIEGPKMKSAAKGAIEKFPDDIQAMIRKPVAERTPLEHQLAELAYRQVTYEYGRLESKMKDEEKQKLAALRRQLLDFEKQKPAPLPAGLTVADVGPTAPPTLIPKKGEQPIDPGFLSVLDEKPAVIERVPTAPNSTGRRTALARWINRPDNPLSTRVIVNRLWQYHFGRGLVATASDFGRLGEKPTHPELLDWLAVRFVKDGRSFKQMHRLILTSATYRQSAVAPASPEALRKDPENLLRWRGQTQRLSAEQIRDAILSATGELDLTAGGPSVDAVKPRRTIYTRVSRNTRDPLLDVFDLPEGFTSTAQRNVTTTATQALLLLNNQAFMQRARAMADRLLKDRPSDDAFVAAAYRLAYGRAPSAAEQNAAVAFIREQGRRINPKQADSPGFYSEKMPYREGRSALLQPGGAQVRLQAADSPQFPTGDFTIEAFVLLRSVFEDGNVRTIASHWSGDRKQPGWSFGVTSKKSAYKPQTLVLQLWGGRNADDYEAVFSGLHIALNKPYFVAVSVNLDETSKGSVTFYAKDLSNDEEPLQIAQQPHKVTAHGRPKAAFTIGGHDNQPLRTWDGLIDDVRLSSIALREEQLLLTSESTTDHTVAFWRFEAKPDPYHDASGHGHTIRTQTPGARTGADPRHAALIDFCHVLLNSNEFLYVD
jgi:mono/diheme cytochrome c family protein